MFGPLGSLPLGGFPESVSAAVVIHPASYHRKRGKKYEHPERLVPPDWEENLRKAREALWLKRYTEAIQIEERDDNLQLAWQALFKKYEEEKRTAPLEEIKRRYFENIPPAMKERMMRTEARANLPKLLKEEESRARKERLAEENRLLALQMANDAKEREKQRQEEIYKKRLKSLKKARKAKAKK